MNSSRQALLILDLQREFLDPTVGRCLLPHASADVDSQPDFIHNLEIILPHFRHPESDVVWVRSESNGHRDFTDLRVEETIIVVNSDDEEEVVEEEEGEGKGERGKDKGRGKDGKSRKKRIQRVPSKKRGQLLINGNGPKRPPLLTDAYLSIDTAHPPVAPDSPASQFAGAAEEMMQAPPDRLVVKSWYSAFKDTSLLEHLRGRVVTQLFIAGLMTNAGVLATVADAARHGFEVTLLNDCLGYRSQTAHDRAMLQMEQMYEAQQVPSMAFLRAAERRRRKQAARGVGATAMPKEKLACIVEALVGDEVPARLPQQKQQRVPSPVVEERVREGDAKLERKPSAKKKKRKKKKGGAGQEGQADGEQQVPEGDRESLDSPPQSPLRDRVGSPTGEPLERLPSPSPEPSTKPTPVQPSSDSRLPRPHPTTPPLLLDKALPPHLRSPPTVRAPPSPPKLKTPDNVVRVFETPPLLASSSANEDEDEDDRSPIFAPPPLRPRDTDRVPPQLLARTKSVIRRRLPPRQETRKPEPAKGEVKSLESLEAVENKELRDAKSDLEDAEEMMSNLRVSDVKADGAPEGFVDTGEGGPEAEVNASKASTTREKGENDDPAELLARLTVSSDAGEKAPGLRPTPKEPAKQAKAKKSARKFDSTAPILSEGDSMGEGDTYIVNNLLPDDLASTVFENLRKEVSWRRMFHRGSEVPRLVAVQGEVNQDGSFPIYRHPSDESPPLLPFTPTVEKIRAHASKVLKHPINHVLIQHYRSGNDYISEHSDKTLDIARGTKIVNVSVGAQRTMNIRRKRSAAVLDCQREMQRIPMPHNSMFVLGPETNRHWLHFIKQDKREAFLKSDPELAFGGERISLTFRHIATFLDRDEERIYGQGATAKTKEDAKPVINGQCDQAERLLEAFGKENHRTDLGWDELYTTGFDVLHMHIPIPVLVTNDLASPDTLRLRAFLNACGVGHRVEKVASDHSPPILVDCDRMRTEVKSPLAALCYVHRYYFKPEKGGRETEVRVLEGICESQEALRTVKSGEKVEGAFWQRWRGGGKEVMAVLWPIARLLSEGRRPWWMEEVLAGEEVVSLLREAGIGEQEGEGGE